MIQIFGINKSFDCKSAQRFFKERNVSFQFIDLKEKLMSKGEFDSVLSSLEKLFSSRSEALESMVDRKSKIFSDFAYLDESDKEEKLFENQLELLKLPVCRNGKTSATVGMKSEIWKEWI